PARMPADDLGGIDLEPRLALKADLFVDQPDGGLGVEVGVTLDDLRRREPLAALPGCGNRRDLLRDPAARRMVVPRAVRPGYVGGARHRVEGARHASPGLVVVRGLYGQPTSHGKLARQLVEDPPDAPFVQAGSRGDLAEPHSAGTEPDDFAVRGGAG